MRLNVRTLRLTALLAAVLWILPADAQQAVSDSLRNAEKELRHRYDNLQQQRKLLSVFNYLNNLYVDRTDMAPLVEKAVIGMLEELDPHSSYLSPAELKSAQEQFDGEFGGIGVEFNIYRDTVMVINVLPDSPSQKAGLRAGDRIVEIEGKTAVKASRTDIMSQLRGKNGTSVNVGIRRRGFGETLQFDIIRGKIPIKSVEAAYLIDNRIGYVRVSRFGNTTAAELEKAMARLGKTEAMILDLRGNGGGIMEQAIRMAELFLPEGTLILSTEGDNVKSQQFTAGRKGPYNNKELVVLIDGASASASEIVAGALQDWDRAVIVGAPSFGKGLVQRQVMLPDSSAVRITVSRYHTPTGRVIQRPYEKGHREEYYLAHRERLNGRTADSVSTESLPAYKTLRNARTVYGGGGITPDIVVPQDTTAITAYIAVMSSKGLMTEFLHGFIDRERDSLTVRYPDFELFDSEFSLSPEQLEEFFALGTDNGVVCESEERKESEAFIQIFVKAYAARILFSDSHYRRVLNENGDDAYKTAAELAADPSRIKALLKGDTK